MTTTRASLSIDRELFVPGVIWVPTDGGYRSLSRTADPQAWRAAIDTDDAVVTQVDDGATPAGRLGQHSSSSSSQPSLVAAMLEAARLEPGMRVLEIGTGTGWTAGLLAHQLGDAAVTTIEVDPDVAGQARAALERAGLAPAVVVGDGADGYPAGAPYDRVLATCAVGRVPAAWIEQTRPRGQVLTPWGTEYSNGALARVTVHANGTASGHFAPVPMAFMRLRAQRIVGCPWEDDGPGVPATRRTALSSEQVYELIATPGAFAVGLLMPSCHKVVDEDNLVVRLHDPLSGSWARCEVTAGSPSHPVAQHGPRHLWDEVEAAYAWWVEQGKPDPARFGLAVTSVDQRAWLDDPGNTVWTVRAAATRPIR